MKTFNEFITEARTRPSQRASKGGTMPKYGQRSGKSELDHDVIMRGIPGSGKSTQAKRLAKATGGTSYGFDDARKDIHGHHTVQGPIGPIKDKTYKTLSNANPDKPRILDNTGTNKHFKKSTEQDVKNVGFKNPKEVSPDSSDRAAFRRNRNRANPVPQFVLRRMSQQNKENPGGREAIQRGRELTKRYRLDRKSTGAKLGLPRRRGAEYMKTFDEFISERYYKPNEKLPSGKTPVQKAVNKNVKRNTNIGPDSDIRRAVKHGLRINKVTHGANNKNYNPQANHPDVDVDAHKDQYMTVHHHPSSINYNVTKSADGIHSVHWGHGRDAQNMRPSERVRLAKTAKHVWDNHVVTNMPHNSTIHNRPYSDTKKSTGEKRNKRAEIYQTRGGFGPMDKHGDQFGYVGRPPSPKQKSKGKTQVQPRDSTEVKKSVGWHEID